jgi:hypothetical protein
VVIRLFQYKYRKQEIIAPLKSGQLNIFEELKRTIQAQINEGHQIRIINQVEGIPVEDEVLIISIQEFDSWFDRYGF